MEAAELLAIRLTGRRAPLTVRERFALLPDDLPDLVDRLRPLLSEGLLLSTCHRFELYAVPRPGVTADEIVACLATARDFSFAQVRPHVRIHRGRAAAEHLLRVSAGLDSPVLGETQVLGQVRRALDAARQLQFIGHRLGSLVQAAITTGKRVQEETALGRGALSVSRVGVEQARRELGDLEDKTVLIVGAGETGQLAGKALGPVGRLIIVNRTGARARVLAAQLGATALPFATLAAALVEADLVISCVGAARPVITPDLLGGRADDRQVVVVDLAMPRSVDPAVADCAAVRLITLQDLVVSRSAHAAGRLREVPHATAIVVEELERAWRTWEAAGAHQLVAALRKRAEEVRQAELDRSGRVLQHLAPEDRNAIQSLTQAIVNKLLHEPTIWLKAHPARGEAALHEIFGVAAQA